jgi:hypothetical protein
MEMRVDALAQQVETIRQSQEADADLDHEMDERVAHLTARVEALTASAEVQQAELDTLRRWIEARAETLSEMVRERAAPSGDAAQGAPEGTRSVIGDKGERPAPASFPSEAAMLAMDAPAIRVEVVRAFVAYVVNYPQPKGVVVPIYHMAASFLGVNLVDLLPDLATLGGDHGTT